MTRSSNDQRPTHSDDSTGGNDRAAHRPDPRLRQGNATVHATGDARKAATQPGGVALGSLSIPPVNRIRASHVSRWQGRS